MISLGGYIRWCIVKSSSGENPLALNQELTVFLPFSQEDLTHFVGRLFIMNRRGCPLIVSIVFLLPFMECGFSPQRVKTDLVKLIDAGVKQVKFRPHLIVI